ncbi:amino-acid N-acetyltransferase [Desulfotomaculum arcticum]|uniref:Amino-acid N-acetyltransferase n=1 Tax=Desulfotruncus arcticus DSM 17038 TaxID=1121424 RepID=A0A1I2NB16_9FIRM|nr:N-acetyltransferase [Desulfotruncus arcticus]SFG01095.1 amino-acid N-acetyltransferase [Desulfotomaculum arcticum] [Desulfotruncus arcticus DSM 17038]
MLFRKAKISDIETIHKFITYFAEKDLMLARSRSSLYECLREFTVAEVNSEIVGVGSLHIIWEDLAEIRALAVDESYQKRGIGRGLVDAFLAEAIDLEIPNIFALTYQAPFFEKCGFNIIAKEDLPQKVWKECINCPKFPKCEEVAVFKVLKI